MMVIYELKQGDEMGYPVSSATENTRSARCGAQSAGAFALLAVVFLLSTLGGCQGRSSAVLPLPDSTAPAQAGSDDRDAYWTRLDGRELQAAEINRRVTSLMSDAQVVGLGVALIDQKGIAHLKAYGKADVARDRPLGVDTVMYGASLTKAAFAYAVMTLVDEQRVDLDAPISALLPKPLHDYEDYVDLIDDPRWRGWTLRQLLSHSSGLPNWRWFMPEERLTVLFEPGTRYAYSGEGIQVAQLVIEEALDINVQELMQARVFDRFEMHNTSMVWQERFRSDLARGYAKDGSNLGHNMRGSVRAAGSMDTTLRDFARFLYGLQRGNGLSHAARTELLTPQIAITSETQFPTHLWKDTDAHNAISLSYALGWGRFETPFGAAYFKEGHDDGWNNYAICMVDGDHCMLLLANSSNAESIFLYLVNDLLGDVRLPWRWEGYTPFDHPAQ